MDVESYCVQSSSTENLGYYILRSYNQESNMNVTSVPGCLECDDMKKLTGITWFPGLFAKLVSLATLSVLTTTANIFLMYVASRTKSLVSNTKIFVVSLSFAHLLGSLIVIPLWIVTRLYPEVAQASPLFCQSASFFWILMILASFYSLSTLSLDRFFIISNPMRYPFKATTKRKLVVVALLWSLCILFASAPMLGWGEYKFQADAIPICGLNMKHSLSFTIFLIACGFGLPLIVDIFCCGRIISIARRQSRCIESRKGSDGSASTATSSSSSSSSSSTNFHPIPKLSKLKQKLNSLRLVFAGTGSFLVCWLPYLGAHVWMTTVRNLSHAEESMPYIMEFVVMCVALTNGLINPVVIMLSNRDYRKEIKIIFSHRFSIHSLDDRSDTDSFTFHSRRSQLSKTFQSIQDVHVVPSETRKLKKQDSEISIDTSIADLPEISKLPVTVVGSVQECKNLMSRSNRNSVDFDNPDTQLEHVQMNETIAQPVIVKTARIDKEKEVKINIDNPD